MTTEISEYTISKTPAGPSALLPLLKRWLPAGVPILICVPMARALPGWKCMWLLAASVLIGLKWVTIAGRRTFRGAPLWRVAAYVALWPGLNPRAFCLESSRRPGAAEALGAFAKMTFGVALVWGVLRLLPIRRSLLVGWTGMIGLAFLLHFGFFQLLSVGWRALGVNAEPLMNNPICAASLAEFWGRRWNKAFSDFTVPYIFAPMAKRFGTSTAAVSVFLVSGLLHELVISLPARGGFGGPTFYFAIQAAGLAFERTRVGRRCRGALLTTLVAALPSYWLFHPIFVRNVMVPMFRAIGAL